MRIAVASGKGGTGKTTVAVSLAVELASRGERSSYIDFDVEAPNGHIFLSPRIEKSFAVDVPVPAVDAETCTACGRCSDACEFNALACVGGRVMLFPEMCHGCGACALACPENAVTEARRRVGTIEAGHSGPVAFAEGRLKLGEAMATPLIRELHRHVPYDGVALMDCPPGTSCPVVETMRGADRGILVTEPTPFGLSDLKLAVETARRLDLPVGVVINRSGIGNSDVSDYCRREGLAVYAAIPDDRSVAEAYSRGDLPSFVLPEYGRIIGKLADAVVRPAAEVTSS
jgi:MinD superfamily P-loop ATPase